MACCLGKSFSSLSSGMSNARSSSDSAQFSLQIYFCQAGVHVADPVLQIFNGQEVEVWPRITWKPNWALTFTQIKKKISGYFSISPRSTLVIKGQKIFLKNLSLDGALIIDAVDDAEVNVSGSVQNKGWTLETVEYKDASTSEAIRIRGFKFKKIEQLEKKYSQPGKFCLEP